MNRAADLVSQWLREVQQEQGSDVAAPATAAAYRVLFLLRGEDFRETVERVGADT